MIVRWRKRSCLFTAGLFFVIATSGCGNFLQQPVVPKRVIGEASEPVNEFSENDKQPEINSLTEAGEQPEINSLTEAGEQPETNSLIEAPEQPEIYEHDPSFVTLCLTGDLMCLGGQQNAAAKKGGGYDFTGSFELIKDYLKKCDFTIGNLETLISPGFPYTAQLKYVEEDCPNCNAPPEYLEAVKDAGFDVLFTCNNHSLDAGVTGIKETIQNLDKLGFIHTGTYESFTDESAERFVLVEKNGIRIGLVAFTELINLRDSLPKEELEQYINCYGKAYATGLISKVREAGADFIIAYNHWGSENTHEVRDYQRVHAKIMAEAGADFIIGTHPHCLQESELILTEDGRNVPCFYSLGNLVSSMLRDINNDTVLIKLTLCRDGDRVFLDSTEITACHVLGYLNGKPHVIVPVSYQVEKESNKEELIAAEVRILEVLSLEP